MVDTETFSPSFFLFFSCIVIFPGSCLKAVFRSTTILSFFQNRFFYYINFDYNVFFSFLSPWNKLSSRLLTSIIILRIPAIDRNLGWNDRPIFFFQLARFFSKKSRSREISRSNFSSSTKPFNPIKKKKMDVTDSIGHVISCQSDLSTRGQFTNDRKGLDPI